MHFPKNQILQDALRYEPFDIEGSYFRENFTGFTVFFLKNKQKTRTSFNYVRILVFIYLSSLLLQQDTNSNVLG